MFSCFCFYFYFFIFILFIYLFIYYIYLFIYFCSFGWHTLVVKVSTKMLWKRSLNLGSLITLKMLFSVFLFLLLFLFFYLYFIYLFIYFIYLFIYFCSFGWHTLVVKVSTKMLGKRSLNLGSLITLKMIFSVFCFCFYFYFFYLYFIYLFIYFIYLFIYFCSFGWHTLVVKVSTKMLWKRSSNLGSLITLKMLFSVFLFLLLFLFFYLYFIYLFIYFIYLFIYFCSFGWHTLVVKVSTKMLWKRSLNLGSLITLKMIFSVFCFCFYFILFLFCFNLFYFFNFFNFCSFGRRMLNVKVSIKTLWRRV